VRIAFARSVAFAVAVLIAPACIDAAAIGKETAEDHTFTTDDGVRLYYRQVGDGPDVLVVPVAVWLSPHLDQLATPGRRLVYYDPRGRGGSETGDLARVSLDRAVRDLDALRQTLRTETMTLIGWSGYGLETAAYALAHPDRVRRLVQLNPVPPRQEPYMTARAAGIRGRVDGTAWTRYQSLAREGTNPREACRAYNRATWPAFAASTAAADATIERICEHEAEWPDRQQKFFAAMMPSIAALDLRPRVRELTMPRVIIHGDRDLIALDGVREWLPADSTAVKLVVIPGADHASFIDQPAAVLAAIEEFLLTARR
jgi:pimeloyl-ACP methyl ester carboxylesterase